MADKAGVRILSPEGTITPTGTWSLGARAGDFVYIPANVPHLPYNLSQTEPCLAIISRTDPNEQESVVLLPELDMLHP